MSSTDVLLSLVEAKPVMAGALGGVGAALILGMTPGEGIVFAGTVAFGVSLGDALLSGMGYATEIRSYLKDDFAYYLDPLDFVGAGTGVLLVNLSLGVRGRSLAIMSGVAAVAGGLGPKVAASVMGEFLNDALTPAKKKKTTTGSAGIGGETVRA